MFSLSSFALSATDIDGLFQTTRAFDPARSQPKKTYGTDDVALVDGRPVYTMPVQFIDETGVDPNVNVQVFDKPAQSIPALSRVSLTGALRVSAWVRDGRVRYTLTADGVEVEQLDVTPIAPAHAVRGGDDL